MGKSLLYNYNSLPDTTIPVPIEDNSVNNINNSVFKPINFDFLNLNFSNLDFFNLNFDKNTDSSKEGNINSIISSKKDIITDMYDTGISEGLTKAQVCGILGNVMQESAFNGNAKGDHGKSIGYFQMGSGEQEKYRKWKLKNSSRIVKQPEHVRQMMYVCDMIKSKDYKPLNIYGIRNVSFNSNDPKETATDFMIRYEKPSKKYASLNNRQKYAEDFYKYFS